MGYRISLHNPHALVLVILLLSLALHFLSLSFPDGPVFDEVYFATFASHYAAGVSVFDIHPPLGKLLLASALVPSHNTQPVVLAWFEDGKPSYAQSFGNFPYISARVFVAFIGSLLAPLFFLLVRKLGASDTAALVGSFFVVFDNALLLQSRLILIDTFLLFFCLLSALCAAYYMKEEGSSRYRFLALAALCVGLAGSVKLTGFGFLGIVILCMLFEMSRARAARTAVSLKPILALVGIACITYASVFSLYSLVFSSRQHFEVLASYIGNDKAIFERVYEGASRVPGAPFAEAAVLGAFEQLLMIGVNFNVSGHPWSSSFFTWPVGWKVIPYWGTFDFSGIGVFLRNPLVMLTGNPVVWWGSAVALVWALWLLIAERLNRRSLGSFHGVVAIFTIGFFINLLPFAAIHRPMFLYHYFPALLCAIVVFTLLFDRIATPQRALATVSATVALFLLFAPFTYGISWFQFWNIAALNF